MTSLVVWSGADARGAASLNIATDSRISWGESHSWDQGRKVFACATAPIVVGFLGDVLFPALAIPAVIDRIERGLLNNFGTSDIQRIEQAIRRLWHDYPVDEKRGQKIFIAHRVGDGMASTFHLKTMSLKGDGSTSNWTTRDEVAGPSSAALVIDGSGRGSIREALSKWELSSSAGTSRAIYSAFVESVASGGDPQSGGAPQLGCLYRKGSGRLLGVVHRDQRYFTGAHLLGGEDLQNIEWRNALFEITDGRKKVRQKGAQVHLDR